MCAYMIPVVQVMLIIQYSVAVNRLDRRIVSDAFYWHEMQQEIREKKMDWAFKRTIDEMKDSFMDHIDVLR